MYRSFARIRARTAVMAALAATALALSAQPACAQPALKPPKRPTRPRRRPPRPPRSRRLLEQKFPGATSATSPRPRTSASTRSQFDDRIVYTDAKATYVVVGVGLRRRRRRRTSPRSASASSIASTWRRLPLDLAIKKVKGTGERKLAVFSDADCPFCAQLENELKTVDNVTIYTFLFPIDQLHPDAARKSRMIWCAPDRQTAWDAFFATGKLPDNKGDCDTPDRDDRRARRRSCGSTRRPRWSSPTARSSRARCRRSGSRRS